MVCLWLWGAVEGLCGHASLASLFSLASWTSVEVLANLTTLINWASGGKFGFGCFEIGLFG
jgi:hypothetical protein